MESGQERAKKPMMRRFAANTGWLVAQSVFQYVLSAVIGIIAARFLGPGNYGILGYGTSVMALFAAFAGLGVNDVLITAMIETPDEADELIGTGLLMKLLASLVSVTLIAGTALLLRPGEKLLLLVTFLQSLQLLLQAFDAIRLWFQMKLMSKFTAIGSILGNIACSVWRIVLLMRGAPVEWFALTSVIQMLTNYLFVVPLFFVKAKLRLRATLRSAKRLIGRSWHFVLSGTTNAVGAHFGKLVLSGLLGDTVLGYYNAALTIALMWLFVPQALTDSALPVLLETKKNRPDAFSPRYQLLLFAVMGVGVLAGLFLMLLAPWVVSFLYGEAYAPAVPALRIAAWAGVFSSIGSARGVWLQAEKTQHTVKYISLISSVSSVALAALFIPLWGLTGAAAACVAGYVVSAFLAPLLVRDARPFVPLVLGAAGAPFGYYRVWKKGREKRQ